MVYSRRCSRGEVFSDEGFAAFVTLKLHKIELVKIGRVHSFGSVEHSVEDPNKLQPVFGEFGVKRPRRRELVVMRWFVPLPNNEPALRYFIVFEPQRRENRANLLALCLVAGRFGRPGVERLSCRRQSQEQVGHHALNFAHEVPDQMRRRAERRVELPDLAGVREKVGSPFITEEASQAFPDTPMCRARKRGWQ